MTDTGPSASEIKKLREEIHSARGMVDGAQMNGNGTQYKLGQIWGILIVAGAVALTLGGMTIKAQQDIAELKGEIAKCVKQP